MEVRRDSTQQSDPTVSVIIINLNGEEFISACLSTVVAEGDVMEIIVVDNGSSDNSVQMIRAIFPHVKIIRNDENYGFAAPANQGVALASGEYLLFLNNDARLTPGSLGHLVSGLREEPGVAACEPTMRRNDGTLDSAGSMFTKTGFPYHVSEDELSSARFGSYRFSLKGACLLIKADVFRRAGGFDDSYFAYFEETDLCWRVLAMGFRLKHIDEALVIHDVGRTTTAIFPSEHIDFLSFRNRITTIRKDGSFLLKIRVLPVHIACCIGFAAVFALTGKYKNAFAIVRALVWHLRSPSRRSLINRPERPTSIKELSAITVTYNWSAIVTMLKLYLVRW
jgi:GT2 family glycosyltransferase